MRIKTLVAAVATLGAMALVPSAAQAYDTPTRQCSYLPYKFCFNDNGAPISRSKEEDLGANKWLTTKPTLYRNGLMTLDSYAQNRSPFWGMRPKTFIVAVDEKGRAIWVSKVFENRTLCGVFDLSCASFRRENFVEQFPASVAHYATDLQIYHADTPSYADLRAAMLNAIKSTGDIVQAVKDDIVSKLQ